MTDAINMITPQPIFYEAQVEVDSFKRKNTATGRCFRSTAPVQ